MKIDDCLAAFAVAAGANLPDSAAVARAEIDGFLKSAPNGPQEQLAILCEIQASCRALQLSSSASNEILQDMDQRIAGLRASL